MSTRRTLGTLGTMSSPDVLAMLIAGCVLTAIELARSIPAWLRVRRIRRSDGISPFSIGVLAGTSLGWVAVAVLTDSYAAAAATTLWLVFHLLLMKEVVAVTPMWTRKIAITTLISLLGIALAAVIGIIVGDVATSLGVAIGMASAAYSLPALAAGMTSPSTAGLSVTSLATNSLEGVIYFIAGLGLGGIAPSGQYIAAYLLFGGLALVSNIPRLVRTSVRRLAGKDVTRSGLPESCCRPMRF